MEVKRTKEQYEDLKTEGKMFSIGVTLRDGEFKYATIIRTDNLSVIGSSLAISGLDAWTELVTSISELQKVLTEI